MTEQEKQEMIEYCKTRISESASYSILAKCLKITLASLTAEPVAWWTGPEPTPTGEIESIHDHETGSHSLPLICIDMPAIKPEQTMKPVKAPKQERGTYPPARIKQARDMEWIRAIREAGGTVQESE